MKAGHRGFPASRPLRHAAVAAALGLGWFWNVPAPVVPAASAQPEVPTPAAREAGIRRDATVLASRILKWHGEDLRVDEGRLDRLAREIGTVLRLVRERHPATAEIAARPLPATLSLRIEGDLCDDIAERWSGSGAGAEVPAGHVFPTGHAAFDDLRARLGLLTAGFWPATGDLELRFAARANLRVAVAAYSAVAGVAHVKPYWRRFEGSDITMGNFDGSWHVVMREAWGDCPRGCINRETHFFAVKGGRVERIDEKLFLEAAMGASDGKGQRE